MYNDIKKVLKKKRTWALLSVVGLAGSKIATGDYTGGFTALISFFGG